jgi:hypothetical protein
MHNHLSLFVDDMVAVLGCTHTPSVRNAKTDRSLLNMVGERDWQFGKRANVSTPKQGRVLKPSVVFT